MSARTKSFPKDFASRRIHSLMGVWLVLFLIEHLLTNSQAALLFGQDGSGFIKMVNFLFSLPYLHVVELLLLGVPFAIHIVWGIKYLRTSKGNAHPTDGTTPDLRQYPRNQAYSWQRITAWVLIIGVVAHVAQMRFYKYPEEVRIGGSEVEYMVRVKMDKGLYSVADRMEISLFDSSKLDEMQSAFNREIARASLTLPIERLFVTSPQTSSSYDPMAADYYSNLNRLYVQQEWLHAAQAKPLKPNQVLAVTTSPGKAVLMNIRDTMKNPWMVALYSIFVITAVYHAFNGLWTASIVWGVTLTQRSQALMRRFSLLLMVVLGFLGLAAAWGTFWMNLRW